MYKKQIKMGKRSVKSNAVRKFETYGKRCLYLRDSYPDESNDSGLGSDAYSSLPESNSSSCLEESDIDCSSDSVDSGISEQSRLARCKRQRASNNLCTSSSYALLQVDSTLALSLNNKMHIQHTQSEIAPKINDACCFDEPSAKWRKVMPNADLSDSSSGDRQECRENALSLGRNVLHSFPLTPSSGLLNAGVLTEALNCGNSTGKESRTNDFENNDSADNKESSDWSGRDGYTLKGTSDHPPRNGDRIAALLSASSNSLARKRPMKKPSLHVCFPSRSKDGKVELCILIQPEEQHRARYMTEGSRGSIKDEKGTGFPTVKLVGYNQPVVLQIFIGSDQGKIQPHLFYQACKVTGKNCTPCSERVIDGTCVIEINMTPDNDMTVSCDCIGILKERNVDVEQRLPYFGLARCKKRSTKCRMVFRVNIPLQNGNYETLQAASSQILCTQSPGLPEICKKSLTESSMRGGSELFIIGKNFQKDAKIVFQELVDDRSDPCNGKDIIIWEETVDPEKEYAHQSHLVCCVPPYRNQDVPHPVKVFLSVLSGGKSSEPHTFTYTPSQSVQKEKNDRSPMHQLGISTGALEINREFAKNGMTSPKMSPTMVTGSNDSSGMRSMLSPTVRLTERCSPLRQCGQTSLLIQSISPSNSSISPLSTPSLEAALANQLESSNLGNPFSTAENVNLPLMTNNCNQMILGNAADVHPSGHTSPIRDMSSSSSSLSPASSSSLPASPPCSVNSNLQLASHLAPKEIASNLNSLAADDHHDVDLMSGINQLATEMVQAQEDAASSHVVQLTSDVVNRATELTSIVSSPASFSGVGMNMMNIPMALPVPLVQHSSTLTNTCNGLTITENAPVTSTVPSQAILPQESVSMVCHMPPLMAKMEPLPTVGGPEQGAIMTPMNSTDFGTVPSASICQSSHSLASGESNQLTGANVHQAGDSSLDVKPCLPPTALLEGAKLEEQGQAIDASYPSNSDSSTTHPLDNAPPSHSHSLIETKVAPLIYSDACGATSYSQSTILQKCIEGSQDNALPSQAPIVNHTNPASDIAAFGIASTVGTDMASTKNSSAIALTIPPSAIKTEKPDRAADLSCFQQTMTLALSQLSEADLLSIINPSTFDTV